MHLYDQHHHCGMPTWRRHWVCHINKMVFAEFVNRAYQQQRHYKIITQVSRVNVVEQCSVVSCHIMIMTMMIRRIKK